MNKVITINLNGRAFQLEEGAFDALGLYLDDATRRLEGNPDRQEIVSDIEQAIADKFRALLGAYKTVVNAQEVAAVLAEMGPVDDDSTGEASRRASGDGAPAGVQGAAGTESAATPPPRRLYRVTEGAMIAGVCNGLAVFLHIDVTVVRLVFTLLAFLWGAGVLVYLVMAFIVPAARTPGEKAAAFGATSTAQEFIKRARAGYYEGVKTFHDSHARRAWVKKFRQEMRGWSHGLQREMAEHTHQQQSHLARQAPSIVGMVLIAPFLSLLLFAGLISLLYALYSLLTAHAVFGLTLPAGKPLWLGVLVLVVLYLLVTWPIKVLRYSCYHPGVPARRGSVFRGLLGNLVGLFFAAFGIWMLDRHVPEFHEWLVQLPLLLSRFADAVQEWWTRKA